MPDEVNIREGLHGCGNHACLIHKPHGQGTNGPCMCVDNIEARKLIWRADQEIERLSALLREREEENRRLREALESIRDICEYHGEDHHTRAAKTELAHATASAALRGERA